MTEKVLDDVQAEVKDVDLESVEKAVEELAQQNKSVVAENESLKTEAEVATKEMAEVKANLEEIMAKNAAPAIITSTKENDRMESKDLFKTFLQEGMDGLRQKGTTLNISTNDEGGYALPEELRQEIIKLEKEVSPLRQVC
jgi:HK97 family phage major capsid protein